MKTNHIGIGIIGLGYMGQHHLKLFNAMIKDQFVNNISIEVICDPDKQHLNDLTRKYNLRGTVDPNQAISHKDVNAVIIASPTQFHEEQALLAASERKAIYCEKPLTMNTEASERLAAMVTNSNIPNQVGLVLRHSPTIHYIKQLLDSGEFGEAQKVHYRHDAVCPAGGIYRGDWRTDKKNGGGLLREANVHDVDILTHLFGDLTTHKVEMSRDDTGTDVSCDAQLYCGDTNVQFTSFWHNIKGRGTSRRMEIFCEQGLIVADDFMFYGDIKYQKNEERPVEIPRREQFSEYMKTHSISPDFKRYKPWYSSLADFNFIQSIQYGTGCYPDFSIAAVADKNVEMMYEAAD